MVHTLKRPKLLFNTRYISKNSIFGLRKNLISFSNRIKISQDYLQNLKDYYENNDYNNPYISSEAFNNEQTTKALTVVKTR